MKYQPEGRKEVAEAVLSAALCALVTGLANWGLETLKAHAAAKAQAKAQAKKDAEGKAG